MPFTPSLDWLLKTMFDCFLQVAGGEEGMVMALDWRSSQGTLAAGSMAAGMALAMVEVTGADTGQVLFFLPGQEGATAWDMVGASAGLSVTREKTLWGRAHLAKGVRRWWLVVHRRSMAVKMP